MTHASNPRPRARAGKPPPAADEPSDAELVARARAGEPAAFEAIVRRNNRLLFRAARGVVDDDAEAQDVVQETYLRAFTHLDTFQGDAALRTWLTRIAINVAISARRKQRHVVPLEDNPADPAPQETDMRFQHIAPETPEAAADRHQMRDLLQTAIEHLPDSYRSVFMLRSVEDMSVEDTAFCLGVSRDVVKTRQVRARAMLRQALAAQMEPYTRSTFEFAGARCDAVAAYVMAELGRRGLLRPQ
jgi:RNA polymerase sigma-70 factor (ECF subfamily)